MQWRQAVYDVQNHFNCKIYCKLGRGKWDGYRVDNAPKSELCVHQRDFVSHAKAEIKKKNVSLFSSVWIFWASFRLLCGFRNVVGLEIVLKRGNPG